MADDKDLSIDEIQARRAARRQALVHAPKKAQEARDLAAIDALEVELGLCLYTLDANGYVDGVSVKMAFRPATSVEYRRYVDLVTRANDKNRAVETRKAQDQLARACIVYPPQGEERDKFIDAFPGALVSIGIEVAKIAELAADEEGKG